MNNVSDIDLKSAYLRAAKIVAMHGEKYIPIFRRLEKEYEKRKERNATFQRAVEVAFSVEKDPLN